MAGLIYRNIVKELDEGAFQNFNLEIDEGEFVAFVGPDGCGKSELLRMAEGYAKPYMGEVYINDTRVTRKRRDSGLASCINDVPLFGSARGEITRLLKKERVALGEIRRRIEDAAREAGCEDIMDLSYARLTPEMRLRAGMARALAINAPVVLINDPFSGMTTRTAAKLRIAIKEIHMRKNAVCVMATRSASNALSLATRIIVLENGKSHQSDTPQNIYDFPSDRFVAEYFGGELINILPVTLERDDGEIYASFGANRIRIPAGKLAKLTNQKYIGQKVLMGVRPENIHYEQAFLSMSPDSVIETSVKYVELKGSDTYLHTSLSGLDTDMIARVDPRCIVAPGDVLTLGIDSNRLHFFDIDTEESILTRT